MSQFKAILANALRWIQQRLIPLDSVLETSEFRLFVVGWLSDLAGLIRRAYSWNLKRRKGIAWILIESQLLYYEYCAGRLRGNSKFHKSTSKPVVCKIESFAVRDLSPNTCSRLFLFLFAQVCEASWYRRRLNLSSKHLRTSLFWHFLAGHGEINGASTGGAWMLMVSYARRRMNTGEY